MLCLSNDCYLRKNSAQNLARSLAESPANIINPTSFSDKAVTLLEGTPKVSVRVHDREWAEVQGMGAFLSVSNGSDQPPKFLELIYMNGPVDKIESPHILIGKGVTFDAGGISIKPSTDMAMMKGDMSGAASTLAAFKAAVDLNLPINLVALIPLTENLINGRATKPGDIVRAMNGKTIEVDNTDAEGRLILADAICYACKNWTPSSVVEMSTLTGAMDVALGYHFAGVFTNSESLWDALESSGKKAGDPFWRMPLDDAYKSQIKSNVADLKNVGGRSGGACTAAIFLKEFIDKSQDIPFAHVDIAGVMHKRSGPDFLASGMTGN